MHSNGISTNSTRSPMQLAFLEGGGVWGYPRKCDFLRSEWTLLFQFIHQSNIIICCIFGRHVRNLNLYRKNKIIFPHTKKIFACKSVIAAVAHKSLFKNSQYCASCSLNTFLLKLHFGKKSRQRKYTHTV
jgi:hypothetical protein